MQAHSNDHNIAISCQNLQFGYQQNQPNIISIPNWQIHAGDQVFLHGPSGSGKSTLLNLICGTLSPSHGSIELLGQAFSQLSSRKRDKFRARNIGVVFQQFNLIPYLSVADNIRLAAHFANKSNGDLDDRIATMIARLQLPSQVVEQQANQLSIGQQQRVAIARALINAPPILVVDEPTSALDSDARDAFVHLMLEMCQQSRTTVLFVSHDHTLKRHFKSHVSVADINHAKVVNHAV